MTDSSPLIQPTPRRQFELAPTSTEPSPPPTPNRQRSDSSYLDPETSEAKRTRSFLNLTSSTLFGIYSPSSEENVRGGLSTPWGTGAQTPSKLPNKDGRASPLKSSLESLKLQKPVTSQHHSSSRGRVPPLGLRLPLLFCSGMTYGLIVRHLHDKQQLAPVTIDQIDRTSWRYLILWGGAGVILGSLMPWVDIFWEEAEGENENPDSPHKSPDTPISPIARSDEDGDPWSGRKNGLGEGWDTLVRGIGAFIGIAFAIRKLPWQSTLQVSLALALLNPVLWYLIDRSKPGLYFSASVGVIGTAIVLGVNPDLVPTPIASLSNLSTDTSFDKAIPGWRIRNESVGVWTWIASVLFCSTLCFGNIGRRLVSGRPRRKANSL